MAVLDLHRYAHLENQADDIDGLMGMFCNFYWWKPFAEAVDDWRTADAQVDALLAEGRHLHALVARGGLNQAERAQALRRIKAIDRNITVRENAFSTHMGEASRLATRLVVW